MKVLLPMSWFAIFVAFKYGVSLGESQAVANFKSVEANAAVEVTERKRRLDARLRMVAQQYETERKELREKHARDRAWLEHKVRKLNAELEKFEGLSVPDAYMCRAYGVCDKS